MARPAAAAGETRTRRPPRQPAHSLEDYFDRLDAALASKASQQLSCRAGHAGAPPRRSRAAAEAGRRAARPSDVPRLRRHPCRRRRDDSFREVELQDAFAALLAAEQAPASARVDAEAIPAEVIDEIARRVIARMGDDSMRAAVLDVAERLVREEIARIKAQN